MSHVKIHKHHFWTLIFSCLLFVGVTMHQSLAENDLLSMGGSTDKTEYNNAYSEEVKFSEEENIELNSADNYSENIREKKAIFKGKFEKLLSKRLDTLSTDKLIKISDRISKALTKIEDNQIMKIEKKEKIISQLLALLEVINDKIDYNDEFSLEIDLEEIFSV